jgi:hypothetical protein
LVFVVPDVRYFDMALKSGVTFGVTIIDWCDYAADEGKHVEIAGEVVEDSPNDVLYAAADVVLMDN